MEKFLVWYRDGSTAHFDTVEEVFNDVNFEGYTETVTVEYYGLNDKYIGEVDYEVQEFIENWGWQQPFFNV